MTLTMVSPHRLSRTSKILTRTNRRNESGATLRSTCSAEAAAKPGSFHPA